MNVWQRFWLVIERKGIEKGTYHFAELYRRIMRSPAAWSCRRK